MPDILMMVTLIGFISWRMIYVSRINNRVKSLERQVNYLLGRLDSVEKSHK